eukprot:365738-Chlamydomonas_euryale.AAC.7
MRRQVPSHTGANAIGVWAVDSRRQQLGHTAIKPDAECHVQHADRAEKHGAGRAWQGCRAWHSVQWRQGAHSLLHPCMQCRVHSYTDLAVWADTALVL